MFDAIGDGLKIAQETAELRKEAKERARLCNNPARDCCPAWHGVNKCPRRRCKDVTPKHWLEILKRKTEHART